MGKQEQTRKEGGYQKSMAAIYKERSRAKQDEAAREAEKARNRKWAKEYRERRKQAKLAAKEADDLRSTTGPTRNASPKRPTGEHPDLIAGILGVQVPEQAETVQWKHGPKTVLPHLVGKQRGETINVLKKDRNYVADLADLPQSMITNDLVIYISKSIGRKELLNAIRDLLSQGKMVVLKGFVHINDFELSEEGLFDEFGCFPDRVIHVHDMRKRAEDSNYPHLEMTVGELLQGVNNPNKAQMSLDFPLTEDSAPNPVQKLDDGVVVGFNQTHKIIDVAEKNLPPVVFTVRSWGLLHQAGIITAPHHDAEGASTFIVPWSGCKIWACIQVKDPKVDRGKLAQLLAEVSCMDKLLSMFQGKIECQMIYAYPGDLVIMPPGQMHAVYTPVAGFCKGGHFHSYDTMHLAEHSRSIDKTKGSFITNEDHKGTLEMLCRMVIALPIISKSRKLYKRSLVALCGMVIHDEEYQAQQSERQRSECHTAACNVAKVVLSSLGIHSKQQYLDFMTDVKVELAFRGEEVYIYELLEGFRRTKAST